MIIKHHYESDRWPEFRTGCTTAADVQRLLDYILREDADPVVLRNDFAGDSPEEIADECDLSRMQQKYLGYHIIASYPDGEDNLWEPQAGRRIQELQDALRVTKGFWVRHKNHWHGFLCALNERGGQIRLATIGEDGESIPVARSFRLMAEKWEDETPGARKTGRGNPDDFSGMDLSRDALAVAERLYAEGKAPTPIPTKAMLRARVQRAVLSATSMEAMQQFAQEDGISVQFKYDATGKILGVSFSADGVSLRGREAGYSYPQLLSLYESSSNTKNQSPQHLRRDVCVAERTRRPDRGQTLHEDGAAADATDRAPRTHPRRPRTAGDGHPHDAGWAEEALRTLMPRHDFASLIVEFIHSLGRFCVQQDHVRRRYNPYQTPSTDRPIL